MTSNPEHPGAAGAAPLRILMYTAYFAPEYSGAALQALTLAHELRHRGHHVEFVTNRWRGLEETTVIDGFAVRRIEPGRMRKHREFRLWFNLARYVWARRREFDVLHSHGAYFTNAFVGPLARALGMKSVIKASLADDDLQDLSRGLVGRAHGLMLRSIDACIGISTDLVQEFCAGGLRAERIHHVPNGVDTNHFKGVTPNVRVGLRQALGLPPLQPVVLYVGVLDQRKNVSWLAEQWLLNDAFGTGALLLMVGPTGRDDAGGVLREQITAMAASRPDRLALHDFQGDVAPYYQCADVLVLPSVKEGLPNVVLEAMACGLPCLAAHTSGSRELVRNDETGCTYAPNDIDAFASGLKVCLSAAGSQLAETARETVRTAFSIAAVADQYEGIYRRIVEMRRRILYVENGIGYGGAIICLRHLVRNLDRRRFDPMVITGLGDAKYQEIASEALWRHIPDRRLDIIAMKRTWAAQDWAAAVPGLNWLVDQVLSRLDDIANFLPSFFQTLWTAWRFRPTLIHVNNEPLCNRAAVLAGKLLGVPVVSHVRGDQQGSPLMHSLFKLPNYFIAVSRWVSESIGRIGVPEDKRTYIYDGIELDKLDLNTNETTFRHQHGIPTDAFVVGLVGLLIPWKGQALFLDAVGSLARDMPDAMFAIVGGTPDDFKYFENELRVRSGQLDLKGRVVFTGHVSNMAQVYQGLSVVLSASTSPEPLGTMIIEAMTMARPIIAPAHGGAVEMIDDGATGLLFKPGDAADLAARIRRLHDDKALRRSLGKLARHRALETFSIQEHVRQVEAVYDRLLGTR